jgi:transglutaminase-like putative cysteine protease
MKAGPARSWDWLSVMLLVAALLVVCQRLSITGWTSSLMLPILVAMLGLAIGLALGFSRFSAGRCFWLATAYGAILIPLIAGDLLAENSSWLDRMAFLGMRLAASLRLFLAKRPVIDPILFLTFLAIVFWFIGLEAGYTLTRSANFIGAVLPGGVALFFIQLYDPGSPARLASLAVYFFLGLLLLGRLTYLRERFSWKGQRIWVSSESSTDIQISILVTAMLLAFLTWVVPVSPQPLLDAKNAWDRLTQPLQQTRRDLGNAVAGLSGSPSLHTDDFYGEYLALGGQAVSGSNVLFTVQLPLAGNVTRNYWRVRTYDTYANDVWQSSPLSTLGISSAHIINSAESRGLPTGEYLFSVPQANLIFLITPPRPVWTDRAAILSYFPIQGGELEPILFQAFPPILAGQQYKVHAALSSPTVAELSAAGQQYPSWVTDRYLQLPADLPPSIPALASQISTGADTPYTKTEAITQYLRTHIRYSKVVPPAPPGEDSLAWFLFDYQAGFCNYYATAEVMMLRTLGIPARLAVGYAQGEYQPPDLRIVRQEDAHAWPEVFFPGIGWVEFEPTASQAPLVRPSGEATSLSGLPLSSQLPSRENSSQSTGPLSSTGASSGTAPRDLVIVSALLVFLIFSVAAVALAIFLGAGERLARRLPRALQTRLPVILETAWKETGLAPPRWLERWVHHAGLTPMERAFGTVYWSLHSLGVYPSPAQTAVELADQLVDRLPQATPDIRTLLYEYQLAQFSEVSGDLWVARRAAESLRRKAWRAALRLRLSPLANWLRRNR